MDKEISKRNDIWPWGEPKWANLKARSGQAFDLSRVVPYQVTFTRVKSIASYVYYFGMHKNVPTMKYKYIKSTPDSSKLTSVNF